MSADKIEAQTIDATRTMYPSRSRIVPLKKGQKFWACSDEHSTFYLVVYKGRIRISLFDAAGDHRDPDVLELGERAFVSDAGLAEYEALVDGTQVYVIERMGFRGTRQSGVIEAQGRLSYIDGCSDSLLVYPPRMGDPCLNYLHFPRGIVQTQHLHPSIRLGLVLRGRGIAFSEVPCVVKKDDGRLVVEPGWQIRLEPGVIFQLNEQEIHSFKTPDESMDIVAYHPDSDWGPVDGNHPMLNRTYIRHGQPR